MFNVNKIKFYSIDFQEELIEMSKKFSDADILSLLNQIPVRSLYKLFLLEDKEKTNSSKFSYHYFIFSYRIYIQLLILNCCRS